MKNIKNIKNIWIFLLCLLILTACSDSGRSLKDLAGSVQEDLEESTNDQEVEEEIEKIEAEEEIVEEDAGLELSDISSEDIAGLSLGHQQLLKQFDDQYINLENEYGGYDNLQRYPQAYRGAKVRLDGAVKEVLSATDDEYEAIFLIRDSFLWEKEEEYLQAGLKPYDHLALFLGYEEGDKEHLVHIKGKQDRARIAEGDFMEIDGRYLDDVQLEGENMVIPYVEVHTTKLKQPTEIKNIHTRTTEGRDLYNVDELETIAKDIFGDQLRLTPGDSDDQVTTHVSNESYNIVFNDQTNEDLKDFTISRDGRIYVKPEINPDLTINETKSFGLGQDLDHFVISDYNSESGLIKLSYYYKADEKLWEYNFATLNERNFIPVYSVRGDDFYLMVGENLIILDTKTGQPKSQVQVGEKSRLMAIDDGVFLFTANTETNQDNLMKVSKNGEIEWVTTISLISGCQSMQIVDGKLVLELIGGFVYIDEMVMGLAIVDMDGNIVLEAY